MKTKILIGFGILLGGALLFFIGGIIWYYATTTCIEWEKDSTGEKCVNYETQIFPVITVGPNGSINTTMRTQVYCTRTEPCRRCIRRGDPKTAPGECPEDRC